MPCGSRAIAFRTGIRSFLKIVNRYSLGKLHPVAQGHAADGGIEILIYSLSATLKK